MLRIDGRILAATVVGLFCVGGVLGIVAAGSGVALPGTGGDADPAPGDGGPGAGPTPTPTVAGATSSPPTGTSSATRTGVRTGSRVSTRTATSPATRTPTAVPTSTTVPTPTAVPPGTTRPAETATPPRTPMLIRRFDVEEIEAELRRLLDEWREERGRQPFVQAEGNLVADLDGMARNHSVAMANRGATVHEIDDRSSADRYRAHDLYWNCWFKSDSGTYFLTPDDNGLEVLGKTYAGRTYRDGVESTDYNANETAVARDVFDGWMDARPYRDRLAYRNASRIGIGIETTRDNEVYVTGNLCGGMGND